MWKRVIVWAVVICGLAQVTFCVIIGLDFVTPDPAEVEPGLKTPLPENPIVFTVKGVASHTLGFIDPDGSNFTARDLDISLTRTDPPYELYEQAIWGPDGTFLVARLIAGWREPNQSTPVIITGDGETRFCDSAIRPEVSTWGIDQTHLLAIKLSYAEGPYQYHIATLNMETCQFEDVSPDVSPGAHFAKSSDGWMAYESTGLGVVVQDDKGKEIFITSDHNARSPTWSRDGKWLAYDIPYTVPRLGLQEGIKIVRRDGTDEQRLTDLGRAPWWSPDGEWLIYWTYKGEIYKINVNTREKVLLYKGGSYPTWR